MKILHTSDWHLGVEYHGVSRAAEHGAFLTYLLDVIEARGVEALVIAGDVFDGTNPSADALSRYYGFLADLGRRGGCTVVVVGGNHDSAARLDAPRDVLGALRTVVVGGYDTAGRAGATDDADTPAGGLLVPLTDRRGEVGAVVAAVPYLHDWRLGVRDLDAPPDAQRRALTEAFRAVYSRLADAAVAAFPGLPLLATGHLTCLSRAGARPTEADAVPMEINRVGTLGAFGPDLFDTRFGHIALGHLHRAFPVDAARRVWYSGTPVQVGPVETPDERRLLLVDTDRPTPSGGFEVEAIAVPVTRRLLRIAGPQDEVLARLRTLTWPETEQPPLLALEGTVTQFDAAAERALRDAAPHGPNGRAIIVEARALLLRTLTEGERAPLPDAAALTPEEAFRFAWSLRHRGAPPDERVLARFRTLLTSPTDAHN